MMFEERVSFGAEPLAAGRVIGGRAGRLPTRPCVDGKDGATIVEQILVVGCLSHADEYITLYVRGVRGLGLE